MAANQIQVGPDGHGSYRYLIDGKFSVQYHNVASARAASVKPQRVNADGELEPVDS